MLKRTPLYETHKKLGARLVEFGGWEMPVQYSGVLAEHRAVRNGVGIFDISHMGEIVVEGERAKEFLQYVTTNDLNKIADGQCQYAALCYENGTIVDDIISYQYSPKKYFVVVNASNTDKDFEWLKKQNNFGVTITNESPKYCQLALQGPLAEKTLQPLVEKKLSELKYYHFCETKFGDEKIILSRTGYTGEDGFEIYGNANAAEKFWNALLESGKPHGILPIGLAARDTLRLEPCYSLYGHEISDAITPLEAGLGWIVKLDKGDFIGKSALQNQAQSGVLRALVGLEMTSPGIPRQGFSVFKNNQKIGFVTSGTFSPTLEKAVALAIVEKPNQVVGNEVEIEIRNKKVAAKVVARPFYKRSK